MEFQEQSIARFTEELASRAPVPGGGGSSALVGAVGVALGQMVGSLTVGKKKYAAVEQELLELMARADALRQRLLHLVQRDAEVFAPLADAYGLPRETEEQRAEKDRVMAIALRDACAVPIEIMEVCCEGVTLTRVFAEKGSAIAVSDAGVSAALLRAALVGASMNVYINTKLMIDRDEANRLNAHCDAMLREYGAAAEQTAIAVAARLKGEH